MKSLVLQVDLLLGPEGGKSAFGSMEFTVSMLQHEQYYIQKYTKQSLEVWLKLREFALVRVVRRGRPRGTDYFSVHAMAVHWQGPLASWAKYRISIGFFVIVVAFLVVSVSAIIRIAHGKEHSIVQYDMLGVLAYLAIVFLVLLVMLIFLAREFASHDHSLRRAEFLSGFCGTKTTGEAPVGQVEAATAEPQEESKAPSSEEGYSLNNMVQNSWSEVRVVREAHSWGYSLFVCGHGRFGHTGSCHLPQSVCGG